jgi:L-ascorbate metabolism protein UlaG (beta-lactamase superfamily)
MRPYHMTPEEAVAAWLALGARGVMVPMHWGTFVLSDEPVLEPPARLAAEWRARALPEKWLRIPRHGETVSVAAGASG